MGGGSELSAETRAPIQAHSNKPLSARLHRLARWYQSIDMDTNDTSGTEPTLEELEELNPQVLSQKEDTVNNIQQNGRIHRKQYCFGLTKVPENPKAMKAKILIDSGNLTQNGVVISEDYRKKAQIGFSRIGGHCVGTAGKGVGLTQTGLSQPFDMRIPGIKKIFRIKAMVIKDLSDDVNLGSGFLQKHNITLKFNPEGTTMMVEDAKLELVNSVKPEAPGNTVEPDSLKKESNEQPEEQGERKSRKNWDPGTKPEPTRRLRPKSIGSRRKGHPIHSMEDMILRPMSLNFVKTKRLPATALIEAIDIKDEEGLAGAQAVPAVYKGSDKIAVLNLHPWDIKIPKGTQIGEVHPLKMTKPETKVKEDISEIQDEENLENLYKELKLDENKMLLEHPAMMTKVKETIRKYKNVFSNPEQTIGRTNLMEFNIQLEEGAKPVKAKVRPLNPKQKASLKEQLDVWKKEDVIEETESPWASALVPVLKKGGGTRWAVDYRNLNAVTIADAYPLPNIGENIDNLQGSRVYSTLDASAAYHTIPVEEKARPLLAFITPFGSYTYKRMPFGAKNAGATYSRFIDLLIGKLRSPYLLAYVDDVIIHTPNLDIHLLELEKALKMHEEAGIKLNAKKTHLFREEADYLGFRVDKNGIHMMDEYVRRILDWPIPKTVKQLRSFLGFTGYYRSFIPQYAQLTSEMNSQKGKKTKNLEWTPEMTEKFNMLKELFSKKPIRSYPRFGENEPEFTVTPDWSNDAIGGILEQGGYFIAAGGRKTTPGERNYPSTKGELSAIIYMLRKFEHILRYKKFIVFSDHKPLQWLKSLKNPKGIHFRWLQELATYDFEVWYKPGKTIGAADGLSRSPHMRDPTPEEIAESEEFVGEMADDLEGVRLDLPNIKKAQQEDDILKTVRKWVMGDPPKNKEELRGQPEDLHVYHKLLQTLHVDEGGILVRKDPQEDQEPTVRILIPDHEKLKKEVFYHCHQHPTAGHFGINSTCMRACKRFYWPGMYEMMRRNIRTCGVCLAKVQKTNLHATVHKPRRHGYPGEVLYIDLVGPLPETSKGDKYIVTMLDGFTKFVTAVTIPCKEAPVVANACVEGWLTKFGCPARIHSDQGKEFVNRIWHQLCDRLQIQKTTTLAYSPQGNLVERFHRSLNQIMRVYMERQERNWDRYVSMACLAYNSKINSTTGVSPFEAWMGRAPRLPLDIIIPKPQKNYQNEDEYVTDTLRRFEAMYAAMRTRSEDTFRRNARLYTGNTEEFQIGDLVWVFSKKQVTGKPNKITDAWLGPYRVMARVAEVLLQVKPAEVEGRTITVHVTKVRRYYPCGFGNLKHRPPRNPPDEQEGDELQEEVGRPERWIEPRDNLVVPVQVHAAEQADHEIQDVERLRVKPPEAASRRPVGRPPKKDKRPHEDEIEVESSSKEGRYRGERRPRDDDESDPEEESRIRKEGHYRGEKRGVLSDEEAPRKAHRHQGEKRLLSDEEESQQQRNKQWRQIADESAETETSDSDIAQIRQTKYEVIHIEGDDKPPDKTSNGWIFAASQSLWIQPGKTAAVDLGLRATLPPRTTLLLLSREKLAQQGIFASGQYNHTTQPQKLKVTVHNSNSIPRRIQNGEKIVQGIFLQTKHVTWTKSEAANP